MVWRANSRGHYASFLMDALGRRGWRGVVPHFRGCSGEPNRLPRAYHSGDSAEIGLVLERLRRVAGRAPLYAAGVSLGGNALLKWLGERGDAAANLVAAAATVSAPLDLPAAGAALDRGITRLYTAHFLRSLKRKALGKLARYPGLHDEAALRAVTPSGGSTIWSPPACMASGMRRTTGAAPPANPGCAISGCPPW
jgi:predicted alpha/beta-fold hydrolase